MMTHWAWLVPFFPFLAAATIALGRLFGWNQGESGERATAALASGAAGLSLLLLLLLDGHAILTGAAPGPIGWGSWISSDGYRVMLSLTLDSLALSIATLAALIAWLTTRFSIHYLHREAGFQRFFALLSFFTAALLLFLLSGNAVLAFVGWEMMGVTSYLLIGYSFDRTIATTNATRAFVTNRFGDAGFVVGITLSSLWLHGVEWGEILGKAHQLGTLQVGLVAGGFILAALAKSAQFPFAAWLSRALEGPTPSSAIFYGALMVHAGLFLLLRLEPLLDQAPLLMVLIALLGLLTALYGALAAAVQSDVKSALLFSAQSQVGLMFFECGLGWYRLAAWHLACHAAWRAYQFLNAPSYMQMVNEPAPQVQPWLRGQTTLFTAALQRFWLDPMTDALITRPTQALARDLRSFDNRLINRLFGRIDLEESLHPAEAIARGEGLPGRGVARIADGCQWFEDRLLLHGGGDGLLRTLARWGTHLQLADRLLSEPRYLVLCIVLTFVVIL